MPGFDHRAARYPAPFIAARDDGDVYTWDTRAAFRPRNRSRSPSGNELVLRRQAARAGRRSVIAMAMDGVAHTLQRRSLDLILQALGARDPKTIAMMSEMRSVWLAEERIGEAEPLAVRILDIKRDVCGPRHPETLAAMFDLASTLQSAGRTRESESLTTVLLNQRREILGEMDKETIATLGLLGTL